MMTQPSKAENLVVGDSPEIVSVLTSKATGLPVDLSSGLTVILLKIRKKGETDLAGTVTYAKLPGRMRNGVVDMTPPYDVNGAGGRCMATCPDTIFTEEGLYEAEIEVTFGATSQVRTVFEVLNFNVRAQF